ncbi:MAG: 4-alpha-glucanotransferase, partial [Candidatus Dormibacteraeota bacterium]|nr:4-alpha-glucanotransferase [Candidatus Dormibacteraeota bacterium]
SWGWAAQLYAVRSHRSWGFGDLADLRRLGSWSRQLGASFVQLNPLHASSPTPPVQASPYFPSSRRFRDPLYIAVEDVPGYRAVAATIEPIAREVHHLNDQRLIDRDAVLGAKLRALEVIWASGPPCRGLAQFTALAGPGLDTYTTYCALAERHGADWRRWPRGLRAPGGRSVVRAAAELRERTSFHRWLQWLLDRQLARAAAELPPICDLAIGADPGGGDAWTWATDLIPGFSVGAPPDALNLAGQDWGFPAFNPVGLAASGFAPIRETVRANLRHAAGLRIDHVMGLFRLWLIPHGASPRQGAYVTYPSGPMLDVLAEESRAASALVVGEDLGTVQREVRAALRRRNILSTRLLWFEPRPPRAYPRLALAAVTTHDLPTVAGVWTGFDEEAMLRVGLQPNVAANRAIVRRMARAGGIPTAATAEDAVAAAYRALRGSPSRLLTATLEDALVVAERPNVPGTVAEWPNWSLGLPGGLEGLRRSPSARRLAGIMAGG